MKGQKKEFLNLEIDHQKKKKKAQNRKNFQALGSDTKKDIIRVLKEREKREGQKYNKEEIIGKSPQLRELLRFISLRKYKILQVDIKPMKNIAKLLSTKYKYIKK